MKDFILKFSFAVVLIALFTFAYTGFKYPDDNKIKVFNKSLADEKNKEYQNSLSKLLSIYEDNKNDYLVNLRLGWLYYKTGKNTESQKFYNIAFELSDKKSIEALLGLTLPLSSLNSWDKVADVYKSVLALDSMNYTANLYLGQILLNKADYKNAEKYLETAYKSFPGTYDVIISYGWLKFYQKDYKSAKEFFNKALMLNANDASATEGLKLLK